MSFKICPNCKIEKDITLFNKNKSNKNGHCSYCRDCSKIIAKEYYNNNKFAVSLTNKRSYIKNIETHKRLTKKYNMKNREKLLKKQQLYIENIKIKCLNYKTNYCIMCGYNSNIKALHFHHVDGTKENKLSTLYRDNRNWEIIKKELDKCIVLCSNCHSAIHDDKINYTTVEYTVEG